MKGIHMKTNYIYYFICWFLVVLLFNVVSFATPSSFTEIDKYIGGFWVGYIFIMVSLVAHLVYSYFSFSENNKEKKILNVPINIISYIELVVMIVVGILCMITTFMPVWLDVIICLAILVFSLISLIDIKCVGENTSNANIQLNKNTGSFRDMVEATQLLCNSAKNISEKNMANKIYEAIRYSDSISSPETSDIEQKIKSSLSVLLNSLNENNSNVFNEEAKKILQLIEERKAICMTVKRII